MSTQEEKEESNAHMNGVAHVRVLGHRYSIRVEGNKQEMKIEGKNNGCLKRKEERI